MPPSRMTSRFSRMSSNEEVEGGDAKPSQIGQVVVHMVSGSNLAAADKGGTSDPYAKVIMRVGEKNVAEKGTKNVKKTLNPSWDQALRFNSIDDPDTQVIILVKDWNPPSLTNPKGEAKSLGQASFRLMDHNLPADGEMIELTLPLGEVTQGKVTKALKAQGDVKLRVGWFRGRGARHSTFSQAQALVEEDEEEEDETVAAGGAAAAAGASGAAAASVAGAGGSAEAASAAPLTPGLPLPSNANDFTRPRAPGHFALVLLSASGLPAADKRGTSDPFAKISVKTGVLNLTAKSKVIKKTVSPEWNQSFPFENVKGDDVEVTITLLDDDGMFASSEALGEVKFALSDLPELAGRRDGNWVALPPMELKEASSGQKMPATGMLNLMIAWVEPKVVPVGAPGAPPSAEAMAAEYDPPSKSGQMTLVLVKGNNFVAADKRGTSDPYAKLLIRTGEKELKAKSKVIKKTLDPEWKELFRFDGVLDDSVEVTIVLNDYDGMVSAGEPLGQVDFVLRDMDIKRDGTWSALPPISLHDVTESGTKQKYAAQGTLELLVAWIEPSDEELAAMEGGAGKKSEELDGIELPDEEEEEEGSEKEGEEGDDEGEADGQADPDSRMQQELKAGDYQLQCHVIEAKDLAGRDANGMSDPCVFVTCFGQTRKSTTVFKAQSAVWDEQLFVEGREQTSDMLNTSSVKVAVYDMDTMPFSKSDLIGEFNLDLLSIYYEPHHEIYRRWVALSCPHSARKPMIGEAAEGGVQGYLKLSLTLLGPGDKPKVHPPGEEEPAESIMMPPSLKMEIAFLVVGVHRAEKLPQMDRSWTGGKPKGAGIDAYTKINFGGYVAKTKVITNRSPRWMQEFWIPVLMPSVGQLITIAVRDYDKIDKDDDVDILTIPFDQVKQGKVQKHGWWHLYGLSESAERAAGASFGKALISGDRSKKRELKKHRSFYSSVWRGKVLLSLSVFKPDEKKPLPEKLLKQPVGTPRPDDPMRVAYELRAAVLYGSNLDTAQGLDGGADEVCIEIAVEEFEFRTGWSPTEKAFKPVKVLNGSANFMADATKPKSGYPGLLVKTTGAERPFMLPEEADQIADVVIYLCRRSGGRKTSIAGSSAPAGGGAWDRYAYYRLTAEEAMAYGYGFTRKWLTMRPVTHGKPVVGKPLPAVLLQIGLRKVEPERISLAPAVSADDIPPPEDPVWPPLAGTPDELPSRNLLTAYEVRLHLYQARDLPAADDDGVSDAFIVAKIGGVIAKSTVQYDTTHPQWYETLVMRVWLPSLEIAPEVVISVWDRDEGVADPDDFIGVCRLPVKDALASDAAADAATDGSPPVPPPDPTWVPLEASGVAGGEGGEVLVRLELLPLPASSVTTPLKPVDGGDKGIAQIKDSGDGGLPSLALPALQPHPREINTLVPESKKASIKVAVLGITGLKQSGRTGGPNVSVMGIKKPFVQVDIGKRAKGKKKGKGGGGGAAMRKTMTSSKPSPYSPLYLELLELQPMLPTNPLLLPPLCVAVHDSLFGGMRTPLLGSSIVNVGDSIPESFFSTPKLGKPTGVAIVEAWENERWHMLKKRGWQPTAKGSADPPNFSGEKPPFASTPKDEFKLPSSDWEWTSEWQVDLTPNPDGGGWLYASEFEINGRVQTFVKPGRAPSYVRRRKWVRTRERVVTQEMKMHDLLITAMSVKEEGNGKTRSRAASRVQSRRLSMSQKRNSIAIDIESLSSKSGLGLGGGGGGGGMLSARSGYGVLEDDGAIGGGIGSLSSKMGMAASGKTRMGAPLDSYSGRLGDALSGAKTTSFPSGPSGGGGAPAGASSGRGVEFLGDVEAGGELPRAMEDDDDDYGGGGNDAALDEELRRRRTTVIDNTEAESKLMEAIISIRSSQPRVTTSQIHDKLTRNGWVLTQGQTTKACVKAGMAPPGAQLIPSTSSQRILERKKVAMAGKDASRASAVDMVPGTMMGGGGGGGIGGADGELELTEEAWIEMIESVESQVVYKRQQLKRLEKDAEDPSQKRADRARLKSRIVEVTQELIDMEDDLVAMKAEFDADMLGISADGGEVSITPKYMKGRITVDEELENQMDDIPFERYTLMSGQGKKRCAVGTLKALVRAGDADMEWSEGDLTLIDKLRTPSEYVVRVYIIRGDNLMSLDDTGASDPYLKVILGGQKFDNRSEHLNDVTTAHFCKMFEMHAGLPGIALLRVECWDYDGFGRRSDDLIGATELDLEDRVFSEHWKGLSERPPVERRQIYSSMSSRPQGSLDMWVDILTPEEAEKNPPIDISPPPEQKFELRVICWSAKDVPEEARDDSGLFDAYASVKFGKGQYKSTDTHFRAQNGKASWNWRFKIPITMDSFVSNELLKLSVQMWDKDLISSNDCIGEESISLAKWLKQIYTRRAMSANSKGKGAVYWFAKDNWDLRGGPAARPKTDEEENTSRIPGLTKMKNFVSGLIESQPLLGDDDPDLEAAKFWLPVQARGKDKHQGKLLLSIQLVPTEEVEKLAAGRGRSEPNTNPVLPKPVGRLSFTLNPFKMMFRLIGPKYCRKLQGICCCLCCIMIGALMVYYMFPVVFANLLTGNVG